MRERVAAYSLLPLRKNPMNPNTDDQPERPSCHTDLFGEGNYIRDRRFQGCVKLHRHFSAQVKN
jgi:hypothetical protein